MSRGRGNALGEFEQIAAERQRQQRGFFRLRRHCKRHARHQQIGNFKQIAAAVADDKIGRFHWS